MSEILVWLYDEALVIPLTFIIFAAGLYLSVRLRLLQGRHFIKVIRSTLGEILKPGDRTAGEISPFQALTTALAATVGTGNIAGVATAIFLGGPGAIFWMWVSAFLGMATKYSEIVLAVFYRTRVKGDMAGGPMYFLERGLKMPFLALLFALFGSLAAFGIGNMVQANSVADAVQATFAIPPLLTGLAMAFLGGLVILGGIRRIAVVTSAAIPAMAVFYLAGAFFILYYLRSEIPAAFATIFTAAFQGRAAAGGLAGVTVLQAWRFGIARGIFTNEAGLGSASIAHAVARTSHPARQGMWGILEVFIDTHVICTVTALVLLVTGAAQSGLEGAAMTVEAYNRGLPGVTGQYIIAIGLAFFAFSTLLSWSYYGEKCFEYIMGGRGGPYYRFLWILIIPVGAVGGLRAVWTLADILNGLMALPNLVGLVGLSSVLVRLTREYFGK
ncbi:MAG: sodium:alanine symporter family protein [Bacillota bacterium]